MITDEDQHKTAKRPIAHAYAMTSLLDYEPFVDSTSRTLVERLSSQYANTGKLCDFGELLQWYAFDVIGEMTFSSQFGFLEQGKDVGDIIKTLNKSGACECSLFFLQPSPDSDVLVVAGMPLLAQANEYPQTPQLSGKCPGSTTCSARTDSGANTSQKTNSVSRSSYKNS